MQASIFGLTHVLLDSVQALWSSHDRAKVSVTVSKRLAGGKQRQ